MLFLQKHRFIAFGLIWCLLSVIPAWAIPADPILMPPYLQAVTTHSIYVLVESATKDPVIVEYGLGNDFSCHATTEWVAETTTNPKTFVHHIQLTDLQPNSVYQYRVLRGTAGYYSASFRTAVNPGTGFRFAWMADCRTGNITHDAIDHLIQNANPYFSIYGGDLAPSGAYQDWKTGFFQPGELALSARVPFFNTAGNHEGWAKNTEAFTQAPDAEAVNRGYYSFTYGDLHVLVLNTEDSQGEKIDAPQYKFAQEDLATSRSLWKIVVSHIPAYCAGGHGENEAMKIMTAKIFEPNHVNMVISGHSHFYQHNLVNGIHHFIIGSAGAPLYTPERASYVLKSVKDYNFAIMDVSPHLFHITIYNAQNNILDELELKQ